MEKPSRKANAAPAGLRLQAETAIGQAGEGFCPLCNVPFRVHDGVGCCPCCGDSYRAEPNRIEMRKCSEHGCDCEHWEAVWASRSQSL